MTTVKSVYDYLCQKESDINEHLPVLKEYAEKCSHVTEMGVRYVVSSFAFALATPKTFISIDLFHPKVYGDTYRLELIQSYCKENNINFEFKLQNTLEQDIEPTELLFIDTLHVYGQLKGELAKHAKNVSKYIIFHDTTTYETTDEKHYYNVSHLDTSKTGLWPAVQEFLDSNSDWYVHERRTNNNGLTIIAKKSNGSEV